MCSRICARTSIIVHKFDRTTEIILEVIELRRAVVIDLARIGGWLDFVKTFW